jgi:hypothetical protein
MTAPAFTPPTPVRCAVRIQGQTIADGSDPASTEPTALSGLRITWGRGTTVDQPDSASVSFEVEDKSGNRTFARLASLGRIVEVTATGTTYSADTAPTFLDPGFEAAPIGPAGPRARADASTAATIEAGPTGHRLRVAQRPGQTGNTGGVLIPPAPFGDPSDPTSWDAIPVAQPGQPWHVTIPAITRAPGSRLYAYAAQLASPWDPNPPRQLIGEIPPALADWTATYTPTRPGTWQGLYVTGNPAGWRWIDVAPAVTWQTLDPALTWQDAGGFTLDGADIAHPAGSLDRTVLAFVGRITDAEAHWDEGVGACVVSVTAADNAAELANRDVGAEPWPMETLAARAARILTASGAQGVTLYVDDAPGAYLVGRVDVDRQQVYPMLADLATTADAVLWSAGHSTTGAYLRIEDPHNRPPLAVLIDEGGVIVIGSATASSTVLSACDFDLDPVRYLQTNSDIATRSVVYWQDQTGDPDPVERSAMVVDDEAEAPDGPWGVRRVSVTSQLVNEPDALAVGGAVLRRLGPPSGADPESAGWRIAGLTYRVEPDADTAAVDTALALLDDTTRIGRSVTVTDLPAWSPIPGRAAGYLEGGVYQFTGGAWSLDLLISSATGLGASAAWIDLDPSWQWQQFDPGIRWIDLLGVGVETDSERAA